MGFAALLCCLCLGLLIGCGGGGGGGGSGSTGGSGSGGEVRGIVQAPSGVPLANLSPALSNESSVALRPAIAANGAEVWIEGRPDLQSRTDTTGRFVITGVPLPGPVRVISRLTAGSGNTFLARSRSVYPTTPGNPGSTSSPGGTEPATGDTGTFQLASGVNFLLLRLRDLAGNSPAFSSVTVWDIPCTSTSDGLFLSPALPANASSADLVIAAPGYQSRTLTASFFSSARPPLIGLRLAPLGASNQPPAIFLDPVTEQVAPDSDLLMRARFIDLDEPDPTRITPTWTVDAGTITAGGDPWQIRWRTPSQAGFATVTVRVIDSGGLEASEEIGFAIGGSERVIPRIATFTPSSGPAGRSLTITGSGFGPAGQAGNAVFIGSESASILSWSPTSITVTVPANAVTGVISVRTGEGTVVGSTFTVLEYPISFTPAFGPPQTIVTLQGFGFNSAVGTGSVLFNEATATILLWSDQTIRALVPHLAVSGTLTVRIAGRERVAGTFSVSSVRAISPTVALRGTEVTIDGRGFGSQQGNNTLAFAGNATATPRTWTDTRIITAIPLQATSGPITLTIQGVQLKTPTLTLTYANNFQFEGTPFGELRLNAQTLIPGLAITNDGILLCSDIENGWIWRFNLDGSPVGRFGNPGDDNGQFNRPWGIIQAPDGTLVVADSFNARLQFLDTDGNWIQSVPGTPTLPGTVGGQFDLPLGLAVDSAGNLFVADSNNNRLQMFDGKGVFQREFGVSGTGPNQLLAPSGVAVTAAGRLLVADRLNHRIQTLSQDGTFQGWLGRDELGNNGWHAPTSNLIASAGSQIREFFQPRGVAVDTQGTIYVADTGNHRVQIIPTDGTLARQIGQFGQGPGQFDSPTSIVLKDGDLFVADAGNQRVQRLSSAGVFLETYTPDLSTNLQRLPTGVAVDRSKEVVYVVDTGTTDPTAQDTDGGSVNVFTIGGDFLRKIGSTGSGDGQLKRPRGIALDPDGNLVVADTGNARIQVFSSDGAFIRKFGAYGTGAGQFQEPQRVAVDADGTIYVADTDNNRVQTFDSNGTFRSIIGGPGTGNGLFNGPSGVAVDTKGRLYIADLGNHRVQKFTTAGDFLGWWGLDADGFAGWHGTDTAAIGIADPSPGRFDMPIDLQVDEEGCVWVVDLGNRNAQKFAPDQSQGDLGGYLGGIDMGLAIYGLGPTAAGRLFLTAADGKVYRIASSLL